MTHFLVMDVDGTLTDGKIYMGNNGEVMKAFNIKDGYGIADLAMHEMHMIPVIITARESAIVRMRCRELHIEEVHQGCRNKLEKLEEILHVYSEKDRRTWSLRDTAFIGDDILDLKLMKPIREAGGLTGCPHDAVQKVKETADYISPLNGGEGCVRDFVEWIRENGYENKDK